MYIKSIEINGFKSYGNKTEIKGFDPLFNAITGLNGSGKSNILDSICFVLGISNLSHVRASSLQELVYKNGQAGITKASVSITFDNNESSTSPVGYEQQKEITVTRIIAIGGRNKYLINGSVAHNHRVQDFFQSVQLNVNNPHFLIMQGRITKVLNMKPLEILSMVEEAAGTRMYEVKKENSMKLIAKKEERLAEIDNILLEDITPTLEKLKNDRKDYLEFAKVTREYEHLSKLHIAWKFTRAQQTGAKSKDDVKTITEELENTRVKVGDLQQQIKAIEGNLVDLEKKRDEEAGNKLHSAEAELKAKQMEESKVNNTLQNTKSALNDDNKKKNELTKNCTEEKNSLVKRQKDVTALDHKVSKLKEACALDEQAVSDAEKHLHDVNAGLVKDAEGKASSIAAQQMTAEEDIKRSETEEKMATMSLGNLEKDLKKKQSSYTEMDDSYKNNEGSLKKLEAEAKRLKAEMEKLNYEDGKAQSVKYEKETLEKEVRRLQNNLDEVQSRFPQLSFDYTNPTPNFDRRKVHGLVCNLIGIKDLATATALELTAGSRLHNVVVEDESTAKLLISKGQLRHRHTFIPLNKIIPHPIEPAVVQRAENLVGKQNVRTALSLITYDPKVKSAMEFVFGGTFVCSNMEAAKKVTFADGIKKKSVTLEGEIFDPAGTLSGGSMNQRNKLLTEMAKIKDIQAELSVKKQNLQNASQNMQKISALAEKYQTIQGNYDMKTSEVSVLKSRIEQSNYHHQVKEIDTIKATIEEKKALLTKCKEVKKKAEEKLKELKRTDTKSARQQELKNAEKMLTDCQKQSAKSSKEYKQGQQELEQAQLECEDLIKSIANYEEQLVAIAATILDSEAKVQNISDEHKSKKDDVSRLLEEVKSQKAILRSHSLEIGKLGKDKETMTREIENSNLHIQQLEHDIAKCESDSNEAQKLVNHYLDTYEWIEEENKYFGVANTEYDFSNYDAKSVASNINKLQDAKNKLSKTVNMRAQNMLTSAEEQYKDLLGKKKVVLEDKQQIEAVIKELDEKKKVALKGACEKVNKDFGSIFSTLLPGAKSKLVPQDNHDVLDGLEFKVGFGDVWKDSLTELSGGQRSLVALSLILSLLLFKPAPIYILDEVDAALDLSHTQNIGQMLKKHFQKSQFIVVSLKDGMFNNANVLFKTKFVDGMSTVSRTSQKKC